MLDEIYTTLDGQLTGALAGKYAAVMSLVSAPLQTAMAINLIIVGFAVMRGISNEPFGNYLGTWLKCYLVILAATSTLAPQIAAAAQQFPDQLASAMGGGPLSSTFDAFVKNATAPALAIHSEMEPWFTATKWIPIVIPNLMTGLMVIIIMVATYIIAGIAMTVVLFIKFGLFVTIATMPIFVGALIFPSSSGLFFSWLGSVLSYAIQTAAVSIALVFVVALVSQIPTAIEPGAGGDTFTAVAAMMGQLVTVLVGGFLILQAQSIGSFAGGGGSSAGGFLSAIYPTTLTRKAAGKLTSMAGSGAKSTARGTAKAAVWTGTKTGQGAVVAGRQIRAAAGRLRVPGASTRKS